MEAVIKSEFAGAPENNVLTIDNQDLGKKVMVINPGGKTFSKIILNGKEGWVPKYCIEMVELIEYCETKNDENHKLSMGETYLV